MKKTSSDNSSNDTVPGTTDNASVCNSEFATLLNNPQLAGALQTAGLSSPTDFQKTVLPLILSGKDLVLSGSRDGGKTLAALIGILAQVEAKPALQSIVVMAGETSSHRMVRTAAKELHINVADLGRVGSDLSTAHIIFSSAQTLAEALRNNSLNLAECKTLLIDDLDRLLDTGLSQDIEAILEKRNAGLQTILASASKYPQIEAMAGKYLRSAEFASADAAGHDASQVEHIYYEVGGDLMSKPAALSDILEVSAKVATIVICNSPSDLDLIEAILKKRGLKAGKIREDAQPRQKTAMIQESQQQPDMVLVATDLALRGVESNHFGLLVNYAVHSEPEVYVHRAALVNKTGKSVSLVGPLDYSHFHFVRKFAGFNFVKAELPSREETLASKVTRLADEAQRGDFLKDDKIKLLVDTMMGHKQRDAMIALLMHNTVNLIPSLEATQSAHRYTNSTQDHGGRHDGDRYQERNRYNEEDSQHGQDRRSRRGQDRNRGQDRRGPRRDQQRGFPANDGFRGEAGAPPPAENGGREHEQRGFANGGSNNGPEAELTPARKEIRFYLGAGKDAGLNGDSVKELLISKGQIDTLKINRVNVRENYSFFDLTEDLDNDTIERLNQTDVGGSGHKAFVRKATYIPVLRERNAGPAASEDAGRNEGGNDQSLEPAPIEENNI